MFFLVPLCLFLFSAHAQTLTTTLPNGPTVVQVVTANLGVPTTQTIETLTSLPSSASSSSSSSSSATTQTTAPQTTTTPTTTTTTAQQGPGPVGQPGATTGTPGAPTPYIYTTVLNGVTTAIADTFTPTSPATLPISIGASGTILDYSSWLSIYGPPKSASSSAVAVLSPRSALIFVLAVLLCLIQ